MNKYILPVLLKNSEDIKADFDSIPSGRLILLRDLARYISGKKSEHKPVNLIFICTHNSRRSHMSHLWAVAASIYYNITGVNCFSGGTEATSFNYRAVEALQNSGFQIVKKDDSSNPIYLVSMADNSEPIETFSKRYDDPFNPQLDFAAIMTCSEADEACPVVIGADARFSVSYNDPKEADGTAMEAERYAARSRQIAAEMLYLFSKVK